ncbi:DUF4224 domain-containing protein [Paraburkholderia sp.]|jgi:hypothetical protein|uniref:DUF4224 domain-containing protein n=1 Tax=Paraburkholderia sp. TaxID=1926495 RepID=UPI002F42FF35
MDSMFLTDEELTGLTCKQRNSARIRVLNSMGIQHKIRPDGSVAVLRAHVDRLFGEKSGKSKIAEWQPSWV